MKFFTCFEAPARDANQALPALQRGTTEGARRFASQDVRDLVELTVAKMEMHPLILFEYRTNLR